MSSLSSTVTVDVMRVKTLFQHEDNALTTSPCVEVSLVHDLVERIDDEDARAAYVKTTRAGREEESPFLNETFVFDTTFILKALPLTELGLGDTTAGDGPAGAASISLGRPPKDYGASIRLARSEREAAAAGTAASADGAEDGSESGGSGANVDKHVTLHFRVLDTNRSPATLVAECRMKNISVVAAAGKAEHGLTLVRRGDPEVDDAGLLSVRLGVAVSKPEAQMADPDADVKLPYVPRFSGDYPLVPEERLNVAWHLSNDAAWRDRVIKAAVLAFPPEKGASTSAKGRGGKTALGSSMKRAAGGLGASTKGVAGDAGDDGSGLAALVRDRWRCRRLHQLFTKFRFACERQMVGAAPLAWTPEEELTQKALWVDSAAVRNMAVTRKSKKVAAGLERSWLLYLTGEAPADSSLGATMPFEYRTKMSTATFTRSAYEALVSSFIEMMLPPLAGASIVGLIAKETYEADPAIPGTRAFKAAAALAAEAPADGVQPPSANAAPPAASPPTSPLKGDRSANAAEPTSPLTPAPPAKARPGEAAFDAFKAVVTAYADWWGETFTETEYLAQLRALDSTLLLARQKMDAGGSGGVGGGAGLLGASMKSASGKKKGGGSSKKKKKG
jgi:hypothetical protein